VWSTASEVVSEEESLITIPTEGHPHLRPRAGGRMRPSGNSVMRSPDGPPSRRTRHAIASMKIIPRLISSKRKKKTELDSSSSSDSDEEQIKNIAAPLSEAPVLPAPINIPLPSNLHSHKK
jgi:hypothetical protein